MGKLKIYYAIAVLFIISFSFAPTASGQEVGDEQAGVASWYGAKYHGRRTASGEVYNRFKHTAAHNGLPMGTKVKVTNMATGKSIIVKVNDTGPFRAPRVIDLSEAAFKTIASRKSGLINVQVEVVELPAEFLAQRAAEKAKAEEEANAIAATAATNTEALSAAVAATPSTATAGVLAQQKYFVVQAGAFSTQGNAELQVEKLRRIYQKMPIARQEDIVNGKTVHRIIAGRFANRAEAEKAKKELESKGFGGLVKEIAEAASLASAL
ncbi:septal ring lytic transglycosylase RlpA family protein [Rufibacter roseus]|uniref:Probable endolytic peptidoglycan transglycosylase RlpA n=1 Tax=Rufibacter roseus TaxID=1567108 RepID=A0ABW2DJA8_9BACT|nr:septal ring lytic transglycosylase RlpA family protein [Rufibacter roseus]